MMKNDEISEELGRVAPLLTKISRKNVLEIPEHYFDSLPSRLLNKVKADELLADGGNATKPNPFTVPEGYFEGVAASVLDKVKAEPQAKVVPMYRKIWNYSAAAIVAGIIFISMLFIFNSDSSKSSRYMAVLENYDNAEKLSEGFASLSDEEIVVYLENHGSVMDNDNLIKDVDEAGLPSLTDYMLDENTLNDYLEQIKY